MREKVTACGISAFIVATTLVLMPYMDATLRNNRVYLLGVAIIFFFAVKFLRYSLPLSFLLFYLSFSFFFSRSQSVGSSLYHIAIFSSFLYLMLKSEFKKEWVYNAICGVIIANVVVQLGQIGGVNFPRGIGGQDLYGWPGMMGNVNETSCLMAIGLPFFFRRKWNYLIPIVVVGLFLSRTTNGIIAVGFVSSFFLFTKLKDWYDRGSAILIILAFVSLFVVSVDRLNIADQIKGRGKVWKETVTAANVKTWGWEFGQYEYVMPLLTYASHIAGNNMIAPFLAGVKDKKALDEATMRMANTTDVNKAREYVIDKKNGTTAMFIQAHNEYLELWFATGYAGIGLFLLFLVRTLFVSFNRSDRLPFYSLLASSLVAVFFFPWQIISTSVLTVVCLSLALKEERNEKKNDEKVDRVPRAGFGNRGVFNSPCRCDHDITDLRIRPG